MKKLSFWQKLELNRRRELRQQEQLELTDREKTELIREKLEGRGFRTNIAMGDIEHPELSSCSIHTRNWDLLDLAITSDTLKVFKRWDEIYTKESFYYEKSPEERLKDI